MPPKKRKFTDERCIKCNSLLRYDTGQKKFISSDEDVTLFSNLMRKEVTIGDVLCANCRFEILKLRASLPSTSQCSLDPEENPSLDVDLEENPPLNVDPEENFPIDPEEIPVADVDPVEEQSSQLSNLTVSDDASQSTQPLQSLEHPSQQSSSGSSEVQSSQSFNDPTYVVRERETIQSEMIAMPFKRVIATHKHCCICLVQNKTYIVVPSKARLQVFISTRIFIPRNNRCCPEHLINDRFYVDELSKLNIFSNTCTISSQELALFLNELSETCDNSILDRVDDNSLSDERIKSLTGYTVGQINTLKNMLVSMRNSDNRSVNQALFVFLFKLRTGNSNTVTASIFDIKYEQKYLIISSQF
ncbi:hypothetical protein O3M35_000771 [Rhynocoris fuscipes]|uniref:ZAD domain-containing protein n=1 Tax=Rhynocoris fuscipes TaxID=488301 RepID=A0AAW1DTA8_9HEMI